MYIRHAASMITSAVCMTFIAVAPSFARTLPAIAGVDVQGNFESPTSRCGHRFANSVIFKSSTTCSAGTSVRWRMPLLFEAGGAYSGDPKGKKAVSIIGSVGEATADAVRCRLRSYGPLGTRVEATTEKTQSTAGSFTFKWSSIEFSQMGVSYAECDVKVPSSTHSTLHGVNHDS